MKQDMPVVILCGGRGTRLGKETLPKGLIEIGGRPILWHIMKLYAAQGFERFILCLGFGAEAITAAFSRSDSLADPSWRIEFADTGLDTPTGGRIRKVAHMIDGPFMATYGDGVAQIDLRDLLEHHRTQGRYATITTARARMPFGLVHIDEDSSVTGFSEKPRLDEWINGGFFVFEPEVIDYLDEDSVLETQPFEKLVADGQMTAYRLDAFWACMDTYKEALMLNELWDTDPPWRIWDAP
ncbi:MAG TPA: sugar phosphate nucleotidyltransferase [Actinomycetota bacterium]|nr:sugar phosphate nucleotidyltransferase [Actinomycetota bacterium]